MPPASIPVETVEMTKNVENISIAEPNFDQIKSYWETNEKLESIFALRRSGKAQSCKKDSKPNWVICEIAKVAKIANIYLKNQTEKNFAIFRKNINV